MAKKKIKIFISHSTNDIDKINLIEKERSKNPSFQFIIIVNKYDTPELFQKLIIKDIKAADIIVPILTSKSYHTQWINQEIGYSEALNKKIIPIVEEDIIKDLSGFYHGQRKYSFKFKKNIAKQENKDFKQCFLRLLEFIETHQKTRPKKKSATNPNIIAEIRYLSWDNRRYIARIGKLKCSWKKRGNQDILYNAAAPKLKHIDYEKELAPYSDTGINYLHAQGNEQWTAEIKTDFDEDGNVSFYFVHTNRLTGEIRTSTNMNCNNWNGVTTGVILKPMKVTKSSDKAISFGFV